MKSLLLIVACVCSLLSFGQDRTLVNVSIPVICIRDGMSHASQLISQAVLGTPMLVADDSDAEWWKVVGPDGYEGYVNRNGLAEPGADWRSNPKYRVRSVREATVYDNDEDVRGPRNVVTTLVDGSVVAVTDSSGKGYVRILLPDGRAGFVSSEEIVPLENKCETDYEALVDFCYALNGTPYLWGGCSTKSMDCSGLVRIAYANQGILLPRDAKDQFNVGIEVGEGDLQSGDLLFFSSTPDGNINHVAIYDKGGRYIHSSGRVKTSKMDADDEDFGKRVYRGARRIIPGLPGIGFMSDHPWYRK